MEQALRRRLVVLLAGIGLAVGATPANALSQDFPSPCTHATFTAPARVSVVKQYTYFQSRSALDSDCLSPYLSEQFSARWHAVDETGSVVDDIWFHPLTNPNDWNADPDMDVVDSDHLGPWRWHPSGGFTDVALPDHAETLTLQEMNSSTSDVRVGSAGTVSAKRVGPRVTVTTRSTRYWTSTHTFGPWAKAVGVIQVRVPGTTAWKNLKNVAADGYGRYAYTYTVSSRRDYRVITFDKAPYIWGSVGSNVSTA
ncbi:MAG: hypothetical protein ABIS35_11235 [Terracoccus sp.]